jgi:hypothetical protein
MTFVTEPKRAILQREALKDTGPRKETWGYEHYAETDTHSVMVSYATNLDLI